MNFSDCKRIESEDKLLDNLDKTRERKKTRNVIMMSNI
jgi:hypothetical protein